MLNNRELATLILITTGILACLIIPGVRRTLADPLAGLLRAFFNWRLLFIIGLLLAWTVGCISLAAWAGIWDMRLLKDSVLILLLFGLPALFQAISVKSGAHIFMHFRRETLSLTAFMVAYVNLEPFPLAVELLLQPFAIFIQLIGAVAEKDPSHRPVRKLANWLLIALGLRTLICATIWVFENAGTYDVRLLTLTVAMSIWLPLAMFPFLYATAFLASLEKTLKLLGWLYQPPLRVRLAIVLGTRGSLARAARFSGRYRSVGEEKTYRGAVLKMREFHAGLKCLDAEERQRIDTLSTNAGVQGVEEKGAQVDRREFFETKKLLERISTSQGLYARRGESFWDDRTDITVSDRNYVLPEPNGIVVEVAPNNQAWRAWRRLPSGWVLATGGTAPGDQYMYQGGVPPTTWPPNPEEWVNGDTDPWPPDWDKDDSPRR